jgi:hypothetical protein
MECRHLSRVGLDARIIAAIKPIALKHSQEYTANTVKVVNGAFLVNF